MLSLRLLSILAAYASLAGSRHITLALHVEQVAMKAPPPSVRDDLHSVKGTPTSSKPTLLDTVRAVYLDTMPSNLEITTERNNLTGKRVWQQGEYIHVDINFPKLDTCVPVLSDVVPVALGIFCTTSGGCSVTRQVTLTQSYQSTFGVAISTSLTVGVSAGFVSAEVSHSFGAHFEHSWSRGQEETNTYTFNLAQGEHCVPSMAHVDLECDVAGDKIIWDTWWGPDRSLYLDRDHNRQGGPYRRGQWCEDTVVSPEIFYPAEPNWQHVLPDDEWRGLAWSRPTHELNRFKRSTNDPDFKDKELVVRRRWGDSRDESHAYRCSPSSSGQRQKMRIPLSGTGGQLRGFIACVT